MWVLSHALNLCPTAATLAKYLRLHQSTRDPGA